MRNLRKRVAAGLAATLITSIAGVAVDTAPAAAAVTGWEQRRGIQRNITDNTDVKSSDARCSDGEVPIAAGWEITGTGAGFNFGDLVLTDLFPATSHEPGFPEVNSVGVQVHEDGDGTNNVWNVLAWAYCIFPPAGYEIIPATSLTNSETHRAATATCSTGKQVIGTGARLSNGLGQVSIDNLGFTDTQVYAIADEDQDGYGGTWSITAFAVCANPSALPGLRTKRGESDYDSNPTKTGTATCSDQIGQRALGYGFALVGAGQVLATSGLLSGDGPTVVANEDDDGFAGDWNSYIRVRCANL